MRKSKPKGKASSTTEKKPQVVSRKQKRKEQRKLKKSLKNQFYQKKHFGTQSQENEESKIHDQPKENKPDKTQDKVKKVKDAASAKRKKLLKEANKEEDKTIRKLEKQLNLKNKKKKKKGGIESDPLDDIIPKSFMDDGLGYILEACDSKHLKGLDLDGDEELSDKESMSDDQSEQDMPESEDEDMEGNSDANENDEEQMEEESDENSNEESDDEIQQSFDSDGEDEDEDSKSDIDDKEQEEVQDDKEPEVWEDIYGRQRDSGGNVIKSKYVPPALRAQSGGSSSALLRLEKQLKGQLNRLAESNMQSISRFVEDLYARNSRNDMNVCLLKILKNSILLENALTPERLVMEHAALVSILHANVGIEVGATVTQKWIESFFEIYKNTDLKDENKSTKVLDNYLYFACYLYAFHVFGHDLMFDVCDRLVDSYQLKDIELIILLLRCIGFNLRKDDPSRLKAMIVEIQKKSTASNDGEQSSRVRFMLESLLAIKNNNVKKLPNYDPEYQIHLSKLVKNFLRPGTEVTALRVRLDDLLNADTRGRWWIVGSAWTGRTEIQQADEPTRPSLKANKFSQDLLDLARKMRMNTDARKTIFCTLMSASDYMDAFEKLAKLDLKSPLKERETAFVLSFCCLKEPQFNPFYPHVASRLARHDRKFRMSVQCAIWDRISSILEGQLAKSCCVNMALFVSRLIRDKVMTLACLRKIEFSDMIKRPLFLKTLIKDLLQEDNEQERNLHFCLKAVNGEKHSTLKESLRFFMHHFLLRKNNTDKDLRSRVESAENALLASG